MYPHYTCEKQEYYKKEVKDIVLINKQESVELQKLGYRFGSEEMLHKSKSRNPKYYLTESDKALKDLERIRKSRTIKSVIK